MLLYWLVGTAVVSCLVATQLHYRFILLFIYLFIYSNLFPYIPLAGTYHGNGKSHIHYTSSGIYNLMQLTAGWKEYIKTTVINTIQLVTTFII
jgi:hypothetical protein